MIENENETSTVDYNESTTNISDQIFTTFFSNSTSDYTNDPTDYTTNYTNDFTTDSISDNITDFGSSNDCNDTLHCNLVSL